eukprot:7510599-Pyramimonas_sp.AAC.1
MIVAPGLPARAGIVLVAGIGVRGIPVEDVEDAHFCAEIGWARCVEASRSPATILLVQHSPACQLVAFDFARHIAMGKALVLG